MQWLIDIIKEWLCANPDLVDRGDPATVDFTQANFVKDSTWHELDLSGIVPENAVAVTISLYIRNAAVEKYFKMRKAGNANDANISIITTNTGSVGISGDFIVFLSTDRKIEYWATFPFWLAIDFTVKGWWLYCH